MSNENTPAKAQDTAVAVPDYLKTEGDTGVGNIGSNDVTIARMKICQSSSKAAKKQNNSLQDGDIYETIEAKKFGRSIDFFVLTFYSSKAWFKDFKMLGQEVMNGSSVIHTGQEIEAIVNDPVRYAQGVDTYNYWLVGKNALKAGIKNSVLPEVYIYSATSSARSEAKKLNGKLKSNAVSRMPCYAQVINMKTYEKEFTKGSAFLPLFSFPGFASEDEVKALEILFAEVQKTMNTEGTHAGLAEGGDVLD